MSEFEEVLNFIENFEAAKLGKSIYEIANQLRGYTKPEYTTELWRTATGYDPKYIDGSLDKGQLVLSGEVTDFGHFIAALSDQIKRPVFSWSNFTSLSADHTSWAGDIGSAILAYRFKSSNIQLKTLEEALNKFATNSDYSADIAAYLVGDLLNSGTLKRISQSIHYYHSISYSENVRAFLKKRFGGMIQGNKLKNPAEVDAKIRTAVSTFIQLSTRADWLTSRKALLKLPNQLEAKNWDQLNGVDTLQGSLHFLTHLVQAGNLEGLKFKPYQMPGVPWLGTVSYEVSVS